MFLEANTKYASRLQLQAEKGQFYSKKCPKKQADFDNPKTQFAETRSPSQLFIMQGNAKGAQALSPPAMILIMNPERENNGKNAETNKKRPSDWKLA